MPDPWAFWSASTIARVTGASEAAVRASWPLIADALDERGIYDRDVCLGVIPTVVIETASTFEPLHEYGTPADWAGYGGGAAYAGRGFIQLTHLSSYRAAGAALGVDLVSNPDLAMEPRTAARILAWFWATKGVSAKDGSRWYSLPDLCREHDWRWVRAVVQGGTAGLDRLVAMASALDAIPTKEPILMAANADYTVSDGPARLRTSPTTLATILQELPTGTALYDTGDPLVDADGHRWRCVALGPVGYIADELLAAVQAVSGSQPQLTTRYVFDPDFPTQLQRQQWTCAIRSTMMMLDAIGIPVTPEDAQDAMSPQYVTPELGLLDASGAGIVEVLRDRWGVVAVNFPSLSFDEALSLAGTGPLAIGLRTWGNPGVGLGHWSAVRGKSDDSLVLANPAGTGPRFGQQTLNRQQFDARGPASGVYIPLAA